MKCKVDLQNHKFKTVGHFKGEPVSQCEGCSLRIVGFYKRLVEPEMFLTVHLPTGEIEKGPKWDEGS